MFREASSTLVDREVRVHFISMILSFFFIHLHQLSFGDVYAWIVSFTISFSGE